jgi:hypothetical protein
VNRITSIIAGVAITAVTVSATTFAQDSAGSPLYMSVDCMKSTAADYSSIEIDMWQPMHQERVKQGKINSWALYWVMYGDRSKCDYYTVTTYLGSVQLNADPSIKTVFKAVHPESDFTEVMAGTQHARQHVATELWLAVDGIAPENSPLRGYQQNERGRSGRV